jgi:thiamine biosynthesis lipoprotein ApbE
MFSYALELARRTDGYFDPTVGKKLRELGYGNLLTENKLRDTLSQDL